MVLRMNHSRSALSLRALKYIALLSTLAVALVAFVGVAQADETDPAIINNDKGVMDLANGTISTLKVDNGAQVAAAREKAKNFDFNFTHNGKNGHVCANVAPVSGQ